MKLFFSGLLIGTTSTFALPPEIWQKVRPLSHSITESLTQSKDFIHYYFPSEIKKRKHEEIMQEKQSKSLIRFEFMNNPKLERKNLEFYTDLQQRMRMYETLANHRGLTKKEKILVIRQTIKKHYPEVFADYQEIIQKQLENQLDVETS
jgi:hypothetical protein